MNCIGLDVHQKETFGSVVCEGKEIMNFDVATEASQLQKAIASIGGRKRVAVEEGNLSDWCWRNLQGVADEVIVCDPRWNRLISEAEDKADPVDASRLALLLWMGQLRAVYHGGEQLQKLKEMVISVEQATRDLTRAKNRLRNQFARRNIETQGQKLYRRAGFEVAREQLEQSWGETRIVESLFEQVEFMRAQKAQRLKWLRELARPYRRYLKCLQTIPGFGSAISRGFLAFVGDPRRFQKKSQLWKYCGYSIRDPKTGGKRKSRARRSNQYNRHLKHLLGLAAQAALRCTDGNPLTEYGCQRLEAGVSLANVKRSMARKMIQIGWKMLKNPQPYRKEVTKIESPKT